MSNEQLQIEIAKAKQAIRDVVIDFKLNTGLVISGTQTSFIDAKSKVGPDWIPGDITITILC